MVVAQASIPHYYAVNLFHKISFLIKHGGQVRTAARMPGPRRPHLQATTTSPGPDHRETLSLPSCQPITIAFNPKRKATKCMAIGLPGKDQYLPILLNLLIVFKKHSLGKKGKGFLVFSSVTYLTLLYLTMAWNYSSNKGILCRKVESVCSFWRKRIMEGS